jgi:hypothetical protein
MLEFFAFVIWIWAIFVVFTDILRSHDLSGWSKAIWTVAIIVMPLFGVLIYLIARGGKMHERAAKQAQARNDAFREYVRSSAGGGAVGTADELHKLADLHDRGVITDLEFEQQKSKVLG